jgi:hypothetical protein
MLGILINATAKFARCEQMMVVSVSEAVAVVIGLMYEYIDACMHKFII